jgi:hypothetical protein
MSYFLGIITIAHLNEEKIVNMAEEGIIKNESISRSKLYKKGLGTVEEDGRE